MKQEKCSTARGIPAINYDHKITSLCLDPDLFFPDFPELKRIGQQLLKIRSDVMTLFTFHREDLIEGYLDFVKTSKLLII
jgi:hypothetical protein